MLSRILRRLLPPAVTLLVACSSSTNEPECESDCLTPPAAICQGTTALSFAVVGTCSDGECSYAPTTVDCASGGGTCESGRCVEPVDLCEDVDCDDIPEASCEGDTVVEYSTGECDGSTGECVYARTETDCIARNQVCSNAQCVAPTDPCIDVTCEDEPEDTCEGEIAVRYNNAGTCTDGECSYTESARVDCAAGGGVCSNGRCSAGDPCLELTCNRPPTATCDGDIANGFEPTGTCFDGVCRYLDVVEDCSENGEFCVDGACEPPDPCIGVRCELAPTARCDGSTAVVYASTGDCEDGTCNYPSTSTNCAATGRRCSRGACVTDAGACEGIVCNDPPAPRCVGTNLIESISPGTCTSGSCSYTTSTFSCAADGRICSAGECIFEDPLCEGVICGAAPEDACDEDGEVLTRFSGASSCEAGECVSPSETVNCTDMGMSCVDGACVAVSACTGVVCERADFCDGNVRVTTTGLGACTAGACSYGAVERREDCGTLGLPCFDGVCQRDVDALVPGDLVITEIMIQPDGGDVGDGWFEVENRSGRIVDLRGLQVWGDEEGGETVEVTTSLVLEPLEFAVFSTQPMTLDPGVPVFVFEAGTFAFDLDSDQIYLENRNGYFATVEYVAPVWLFIAGTSLELDASLADIERVGDAAAWCESRRTLFGQRGTPGRRGDACAQSITVGGVAVTEVFVTGNARDGSPLQWIEFMNVGDEPIEIGGLAIENGAGDWYTLPAGTRAVDGLPLAFVADRATSTPFAGRYADVPLNAAGDSLVLRQAGVVIDQIVFDASFGATVGSSVQFGGAPSAMRNDSLANWCVSTTPASAGYVGNGTPGVLNPVCL